MGVPSFYRWLVNKYPMIVADVKENTTADTEFDNLYLDMNGIIHPCFHSETDNLVPPTTFEDVFKNIYEYIDKLFDIVKPRKLLYMAIDGVAPRSKMNQQRARRFRTAKDNETAEKIEQILRKQFEIEGKKVLPKVPSELSDSNVITPGTQFMSSLSEKLQQYIKLRLTKDSRWRDIKVILSDANVPGEGEHKIMSFIRAQRSSESYNPNSRHCLYGLDADLIMLALATHEVHFSVLREDVMHISKVIVLVTMCFKGELGQEKRINSVSELERTARQAESPNKSRGWFKQKIASGLTSQSYHAEAATISNSQEVNGTVPVMKIPFEFLNVWVLREYIQIDMRIENLPEEIKEVDLERIIDDFVFLCFFSGNDFLPHMPTLAINECAIDLLIHVYKNEFINFGGYLIDTKWIEDKKAGYIKLKRMEKFILAVGQFEDKIFKKRSEMRERKIRQIINAGNFDKQKCDDAKLEAEVPDSTSSSGKASRDVYPQCISDENHTSMSGVIQTAFDGSEVLKNTRELEQKLKEQIRYRSDTFRNGDLGTDKVKLGTPGYKERYYNEKFSTRNHEEMERKRREVVQKYTEGLCWVLKYYYAGVPSWNWFYPFHYGPFASDFKGLSQVKIIFQKCLPFKPFDQLMAVLPPKSADALPGVFKKLMLDENSNIVDFYPTDFEVDLDGKRFLWQAVCKLPFLQEERLLTETKILEKELKDNEKERNAETADRLFVSSLNSLGEQIISTHKSSPFSTGSNIINVDTVLSDGMSGFLRLEFNDLTAIGFNGKSEDPDALCVFYELPHDCLHKPHLLDGVKVPEKTVSEKDIVESQLWHKNSGNTFSSRPISQIHKLRSGPKNEEHDVAHKQASIGFNAGRGKVFSYSEGSDSFTWKAIGDRRLSEPRQGFKSFSQLNNRNLRPSNSTSSSTSDSSSLDWRVDKQTRATQSEQGFEGRRAGNTNRSWTNGQSFSSSFTRQPSEQHHFKGWKDGETYHHSFTSGRSFSSSSAQQQSYGRGHYQGSF